MSYLTPPPDLPESERKGLRGVIIGTAIFFGVPLVLFLGFLAAAAFR